MTMLIKSKAIVLRGIKYGDGSLIVDLLTEQQGRLSFIVRIPKTGKARIKKQFFMPMTIIEIAFDFRANVKLQHIKDVRIDMPFSTVSFDPKKQSILLFLSEFLIYATFEERLNRPLYSYIENSMLWLDSADENYASFHLVFLMHLSKFLGFYPNLDDYSDGDFFDMREGLFCSQAPLHHDFIGPYEAAAVNKLIRMNYDTMHLFHMSHEERNRIMDYILRYYRLHIPNMPELQSFGILKELFA